MLMFINFYLIKNHFNFIFFKVLNLSIYKLMQLNLKYFFKFNTHYFLKDLFFFL